MSNTALHSLHSLPPDISVACGQDKNKHTNIYVLEYDIQCKPCPDGEEWDEECQECVPVCFDMFLSYLESWNSSFN